jgi:tRNA(His) 5'-end guanylyltransferase
MKTDEKGRPLTYWGGLDKSKKQTTVEWLETRAEEREKNNPNESAYWHLRELIKDFEQAKAMEKEQIKDAWDNGCGYVQENSQQYYNETFKQK